MTFDADGMCLNRRLQHRECAKGDDGRLELRVDIEDRGHIELVRPPPHCVVIDDALRRVRVQVDAIATPRDV